MTNPTATVALETLTAGLPVRVTLTSGRTIEGYVHSVQTYDRIGFQARIAAGSHAYVLHHYVTDTGLTESVGCMHFGQSKPHAMGGVSTIESLV